MQDLDEALLIAQGEARTGATAGIWPRGHQIPKAPSSRIPYSRHHKSAYTYLHSCGLEH